MMLFTKICEILENCVLGDCFWRGSGDCRWDGPRDESRDKGCCAVIPEDSSGYCECGDGTKTMKKGCEKRSYSSTCNEACRSETPCRKLSS